MPSLVKLSKIKQLPLRIIDFNSNEELNFYNRLTNLSTRRQQLKFKKTANSLRDAIQLEDEVKLIEDEIDEVVYCLYQVDAQERVQIEQSLRKG